MADATDGGGFIHAVFAVLQQAFVGEFVGDVTAGEAVAVANLLGFVPCRALDDAFDEELGGGPGVRLRERRCGGGGRGVRGGNDGGGRGVRAGRGGGEEQPSQQPRQRW